MSKEEGKIIFSKEYYGFEDCADIFRDVHEMFDPRFNPDVEGLDPEFQGTLKIEVTYHERREIKPVETLGGIMSRSEFEKKTYLGDGVYSEFDGYQIKLTTEIGSLPPTNTIYLEPDVVINLMEHINRVSLYRGLKKCSK